MVNGIVVSSPVRINCSKGAFSTSRCLPATLQICHVEMTQMASHTAYTGRYPTAGKLSCCCPENVHMDCDFGVCSHGLTPSAGRTRQRQPRLPALLALSCIQAGCTWDRLASVPDCTHASCTWDTGQSTQQVFRDGLLAAKRLSFDMYWFCFHLL